MQTSNTSNTNNAAKTNEQKRREIALEMEKAVDAAVNVGALKQSQWYQDRKKLLEMYN